MPPTTAAVDSFNRTQYCKWPCQCPLETPRCPPGVSLLMDGCDCCKACARQVGETCNEADTCDYHKGLYCDYSRDKPRYEKGVCACKYMVGTGCEHDGVIYRNGQSFKPSCKYQCVCVNGAIGCVSLCTESQPPRVWCQSPRRVKIRGQCCEHELGCSSKVLTNCVSSQHRTGLSFPVKQPSCFFWIRSLLLLSYWQSKLKTKWTINISQNNCSIQSIKYNKMLTALPVGTQSWHKNCITQTTSWSPCSKTCGRGVSLRISNDNDQCELVKESRLCNLRPCEVDITKHIK
ncbi:hypothetical protein NL108_008703, partial [Boleophthalmus pectinirostris]